MNRTSIFLAALLACLIGGRELAAAGLDEFKIKRQEVFEFTEKPHVVRTATAAPSRLPARDIATSPWPLKQQAGGLSGIWPAACLAETLPRRSRKTRSNSRWFGTARMTRASTSTIRTAYIRVSLGLKPPLSATCFRNPSAGTDGTRRFFRSREGVYVYEGGDGRDFVRLYAHDGTYVAALSFPADKIDAVQGLKRIVYPQDGLTLPVKPTFLQETFSPAATFPAMRIPLICRRRGAGDGDNHWGMYGNASSILAVQAGRLILGKTYICRWRRRTSGGVNMEGRP